jgi:hypothetical protein
MTNIVIHDLTQNTTLDRRGLSAVCGGRAQLWWQPMQGGRSRSFQPVTLNQYYVTEYSADQIQINNQYQLLQIIDSPNTDANLIGNAENNLTVDYVPA